MADRILWATLPDPAPAVLALSWPEDACMYLERAPISWLTAEDVADGVRLETFDSSVPFGRWEKGRVFCVDYELRWERIDDSFRTILIGNAPDLSGFTPAGSDDLDLSTTDAQESIYYLWGLRLYQQDLDTVGASREGNGVPYLELRIPRLLRYPVPADARQAVLAVCEYIHRDTGEAVHHRFLRVEERA